MFQPVRVLLIATVLAAVLAACKSSPAPEPARDEGTKPLPRSQEIDNEPLIAWMRGAVEENPGSAVRIRLVNVLYKRGQARGNMADFVDAARYATWLAENHPDASILKLRARANLSLHRFDAAEKDLLAARKHPDRHAAETELLLADVDLSYGRYDQARATLRRLAETSPDAAVYANLANLEYQLGNAGEADRLFDESARRIPPGNTGWTAWLETQRGIRHLESGEFEKARARYEKALAADPMSYLAREHMAEIQALLGDADDAVRRYEEVIAQTGGGEFLSALAGLLRDRPGQEARAKELVEKARVAFEADLVAYPEATWQHYGDFLVEHALDLPRARDLLAKNAEARPNASSWIALAEAELAAGEAKAAKATIAKALATPVRIAPLYWTAAAVEEANGDPAAAATFRERARALNPRIEELAGDAAVATAER